MVGIHLVSTLYTNKLLLAYLVIISIGIIIICTCTIIGTLKLVCCLNNTNSLLLQHHKGNYGFDPLQLGKLLCGNDNNKKLIIQTMEIFNGRMSMLAVVGYTVQETLTGLPVVRETPEFFQPFIFPNFSNLL